MSFYAHIKVHHFLESYLDILKINKYRNALASFRVSCHVLEIEKGRHRVIERENRKCRFCPNSLENEYHFMLICKQYEDLRWDYSPSKYFELSNLHKLTIFMSSKNESVIRAFDLCTYIMLTKSGRICLQTGYNSKCHVCTELYFLYICCIACVLWAGGLYHEIHNIYIYKHFCFRYFFLLAKPCFLAIFCDVKCYLVPL